MKKHIIALCAASTIVTYSADESYAAACDTIGTGYTGMVLDTLELVQ